MRAVSLREAIVTGQTQSLLAFFLPDLPCPFLGHPLRMDLGIAITPKVCRNLSKGVASYSPTPNPCKTAGLCRPRKKLAAHPTSF